MVGKQVFGGLFSVLSNADHNRLLHLLNEFYEFESPPRDTLEDNFKDQVGLDHLLGEIYRLMENLKENLESSSRLMSRGEVSETMSYEMFSLGTGSMVRTDHSEPETKEIVAKRLGQTREELIFLESIHRKLRRYMKKVYGSDFDWESNPANA